MDNTLPEGFSFIYDANINVQDIMVLRQKVGWDPCDEDTWTECISKSLVTVGIIFESKLVGIGFLAGNMRHAVLCDLVVDPDFQGKGLGRALLLERIAFADKEAIKYLYTELSASNPMGGLYSELGFGNTGKGLFRERK